MESANEDEAPRLVDGSSRSHSHWPFRISWIGETEYCRDLASARKALKEAAFLSPYMVSLDARSGPGPDDWVEDVETLPGEDGI